jgi:hypothetical protein
MRLKMVIVAVSVLFFMVGSAFAADVTGTWEGEMAMPKMKAGGPGGGGPGGGMGGPPGPMKYVYNLKQDGTKLSGSVKGPFGPASEFTDGKIDGNKLTFSYKVQGFQGGEMTIKWEGILEGEEITFTLSMEGGMGGPGGGGRPPMKVVAKRQK